MLLAQLGAASKQASEQTSRIYWMLSTWPGVKRMFSELCVVRRGESEASGA